MCGIIGVLNLNNPNPIDAERLRAGSDALTHRGPDEGGAFVRSDIGMAVRRLSIVDLDRGHQPMSNEDGTVHIAYNGEVYNHAELRHELESLGHRFRTNADTEALLHGYEAWGPEGLLERLRGMYAFAIWNGEERSLFLARDRMGIKPLYIAESDGRFYFASEIRALLRHSQLPRRINRPALGVFMTIGFVSSPHTMFEGVHKLPPAHYLRIENGKMTRREYWTLSYETTHRGSERAIVDEFRERFQECVDAHLMSDVPIGALLSGGVDSTATVAFMHNTIKQPFKTLTVGFEDGGLDEAKWAAASAREIGTEHHSIRFTGDSMEQFPAVLYHQEEPVARPTHVALYHVFKACRECGLKVVMTGEGADELLGGYSWHKSGILDRMLSRLPLPASRLVARSLRLRAIGQASRDGVRALRGVPTEVHLRYQSMIRVGRPDAARGVISADASSAMDHDASRAILDSWSDWLGRAGDGSEFERVLWIQSRTRMPDYINHNLDRMSMAHSVEARPPFLDHTLWEFCASIPTGLKLRHSTEKYLLREAGKGWIPEAARVRPKAPLRVPYHRWIAQHRLPDWAETAMGDERLRRTGLFDSNAVRRLRREVRAGDPRRSTLLMGVLAVQVWAHMFLESALTNGPPVR